MAELKNTVKQRRKMASKQRSQNEFVVQAVAKTTIISIQAMATTSTS